MDCRLENLSSSSEPKNDLGASQNLGTKAGFQASKRWLQLFMKSKSLSLRRKTTVCQRTPADVIPKLA